MEPQNIRRTEHGTVNLKKPDGITRFQLLVIICDHGLNAWVKVSESE